MLGFLSQIIGPAVKLIDSLHTSEEEKLQMKAQMEQIHNAANAKLLELESQKLKFQAEALKAKSSVIIAEATGESWMQRNWRPILMLGFGGIVISHYVAPLFGLPAIELHERIWDIMTLGIGGYVAGRSGEKIVRTWKQK